MLNQGHSQCSICNELKSQHAMRQSATELPTCWACYRKGWVPAGYLNRPPRITPKPEPYWWTYPLTDHQRRQLRALQGGRCAICRRDGRLMEDHIHDDTRAVRGLLCTQCNSALGCLQDSAKLLRAAAAYLERPLLAAPKASKPVPSAASVRDTPPRRRYEVRARPANLI